MDNGRDFHRRDRGVEEEMGSLTGKERKVQISRLIPCQGRENG